MTKGVIRAYWGMHRGRLVSYFVLTKGLLKLNPGAYAAIARQIRRRAEIEYFYAREKKLAVVAQRLAPFLWVGDILIPGETHRLRVALDRCHHLASLQREDALFRERRAGAFREARAANPVQLRPPRVKDVRPERGTVPPDLRQYEQEILLANTRFAAAGALVPFPAATLMSAPPSAVGLALVTLRHAGFLVEGPEWSLRAAAAEKVSALVRKPLERFVDQDLGR
jgi:hypothetical protein